MGKALQDEDRLLTVAEVAELMRVEPKTVTRWASKKRIPSIVTPGGHHRFHETVVRRLVREGVPLAGPAAGE